MTATACFEKWENIPGYEGLYQVSSCGRIRSLDRFLPGYNGSQQLKRGCMLNPRISNNGYHYVGLYKNGRRTQCYVHRIVATVFIPNHTGLKEINHKDEDKTNNRIDNLEWCTHKYNINYGTATKRIRRSRLTGGYGKIPIIQIKDGVEIARFESAADAERETGICASSIRKVCLNRPKFKSAGGFIWKNTI